jgi:hypothetical protein
MFFWNRNEDVCPMAVENDLVLIYFEDNPLMFARIEAIQPDAKPDWYHVRLLMLQIPTQIVTWILRDVYIDGQEFTMNGKRVRLEKVEAPVEPAADPTPGENEAPKPPPKGGANVISLADLKKT